MSTYIIITVAIYFLNIIKYLKQTYAYLTKLIKYLRLTFLKYSSFLCIYAIEVILIQFQKRREINSNQT